MRNRKILKPRFFNWYLFEFYAMALGCGGTIVGRVIFWLLHNSAAADKFACLGMCHLILWCLIYGFTEIFEFLYKRVR